MLLLGSVGDRLTSKLNKLPVSVFERYIFDLLAFLNWCEFRCTLEIVIQVQLGLNLMTIDIQLARRAGIMRGEFFDCSMLSCSTKVLPSLASFQRPWPSARVLRS